MLRYSKQLGAISLGIIHMMGDGMSFSMVSFNGKPSNYEPFKTLSQSQTTIGMTKDRISAPLVIYSKNYNPNNRSYKQSVI